jgi:hypothetical protein
LIQVYLHYDPYTRWAGGTLGRQRMDFLLLLDHRRRVVLEVDGIQHYADTEGALARHAMPRWSPPTASSGSPDTRSAQRLDSGNTKKRPPQDSNLRSPAPETASPILRVNLPTWTRLLMPRTAMITPCILQIMEITR